MFEKYAKNQSKTQILSNLLTNNTKTQISIYYYLYLLKITKTTKSSRSTNLGTNIGMKNFNILPHHMDY